jgi:hypothetical protein
MKPRFIMPGGGQGPERLGYSHEPLRRLQPDSAETKDRIAAGTDLRDEPEAPSKAWVDAQAELAARRDEERRAQKIALAQIIRANLSLEHRIADCQRRAKKQRTDITSELFFVERMKARGREDNALKRIEALEALLDHAER